MPKSGGYPLLVNPLTLAQLFERNVRYLVPLYQRPYVWNEEEQWLPLWKDIERLADRLISQKDVNRIHFLGASVQDKVDVLPGQVETRRLIDGQQRFTTLQLLLCAFRDIARASGKEDYAGALGQLTVNTHAFRQSEEEIHKVWPTNVDRKVFEAATTVGSPQALREKLEIEEGAKIESTIPQAYQFFHEIISGWLNDGTVDAPSKMRALFGALHDKIRIVVIDLDQSDDAQVIFETLNARGTPLLASDLVKNALLNEIDKAGGDTEATYKKYWEHFDHDSLYWRHKTGRGHARRARIEHFLQHTLTLLNRDDVSAAHLYAAYEDFVKQNPDVCATDRLKLLQTYAGIFRKLENEEGPPRFAKLLSRLKSMDIATALPLLMALSAKLAKRPNDLDAAALDLESFLVRRLVCRLSTRGYNRLFVELTNAVQNVDVDLIIPTLRAQLLGGSAEHNRWPLDAAFKEAWLTNQLYINLTAGRLRMILEALEAGLRSELAETQAVPSKLTIEHVMPQTWQTHWPMTASNTTDPLSRDRRKHTIGNLTLVNNKLNPTLSNAPWTDIVDAEGQISLAGKRNTLGDHSTLFLNKQITKLENWDDLAIDTRSALLFETALKEWPRPVAK